MFCVACGTEIPRKSRFCPNCGAAQPRSSTVFVPTSAQASPPLGFPPIAQGSTLDRGYGRVVVDAKIGEGGMGIVWRGWLFYAPEGPRGREEPIPIALKVLRQRVTLKEEVRAFFLTEAEALRAISHPNIVGFHELFEWPPVAAGEETPKSLVLAMEYVDGDTLEQIVARHVARAHLRGGEAGGLPSMPFLRAWYYFQQLLGALAATHALGIVHRDVKPSNVLVRKDGIVKLTDFGIARTNQPNAPDERHLAPGTGPYMSPEQVLSQPLDGRSDLYSAAIVLYEMLSGRPPFSPQDKSEFFVRQEQVHAQPPPIRTFVPQAPPVLDALFARALAKDKTARFDDAIEMGNAFREALGIPDSPEWRAQAEIAQEASPGRAGEDTAARQARLGTLRDFLVQRYPTMGMSAV